MLAESTNLSAFRSCVVVQEQQTHSIKLFEMQGFRNIDYICTRYTQISLFLDTKIRDVDLPQAFTKRFSLRERLLSRHEETVRKHIEVSVLYFVPYHLYGHTTTQRAISPSNAQPIESSTNRVPRRRVDKQFRQLRAKLALSHSYIWYMCVTARVCIFFITMQTKRAMVRGFPKQHDCTWKDKRRSISVLT